MPHAHIAANYAAFAQAALGRSPLYVELTNGVAQDAEVLSHIATLPREKQQPNLLLAAVKYLFGVARDGARFCELVLEHWHEIEALMRVRRTQTNEPARCATLLPALAQLRQPLALLEVGASAGLCLYPDRYGYDYGVQRIEPSAPGAPVFRCSANAATPIPSRNTTPVSNAIPRASHCRIRSRAGTTIGRSAIMPG